jgi:aminoglycoside phosphotransferase (APT) family kinase protein
MTNERTGRVRKGLRGTDRGERRERAGRLAIFRDPAAMAAMIQQELLRPGMAEAGWQIGPVTQLDAGERTASRAAFTYVATLTNEATGETQERMVTAISYGGDRTRGAWERLQRPAALMRARAVAPPLLRASFSAEHDVLLQAFPFDHRLPAVQALLEQPHPALLQTLVERLGPGEWTPEIWRANVVRYHADMRAMLSIELDARQGDQQSTSRLFAKVHRDEAKGAQAAEVHAAVWEALQGHPLVSVPEPLGWLPDQRVQALAAVTGTPIGDALLGAEWRRAADLGAEALATLHQLPVTPAWVRPPEGEIERVERHSEDLVAAYPEFANRIETLVRQIAAGLEDGPQAPAHGDLKSDHLLISPAGVAVLDLDRFSVADPLLDIAQISYHLSREQGRRLGSGEPFPQPLATMIRAYLERMPAGWEASLGACMARTVLGKTAAGAHGRNGGGADKVEAGLQEAEDALTGRLWHDDQREIRPAQRRNPAARTGNAA